MDSTILLDKAHIARTIERLASQILENYDTCDTLLLVGIQRRGADLAKRLSQHLATRLHKELPLGTLDINLYRDDWTSLQGNPHIGASQMPSRIDGKTIILVDDVLYTGRTIRAALEALLDYGRPQKVELMVLLDRGHRELPIQADYIGHSVTTATHEHVDVLLEEKDGIDEVRLNHKS